MEKHLIYDQYMYSYPHKTAYRPLRDIDLNKYLTKLSGEEDTLYFHIPFCETKCGYCNLFSVTGQKEEDFDVYIRAMERQCQQYALKDNVSFRNLVLGGGTPLLLSVPQLERTFELAEKYCHTSSHQAFTITETSPNQTDEEKLSFLKERGVNRISIGVQSFHDTELAALHRRHKAAEAERALTLLKEHQFDVLNVDLIYGIPGQTAASLQYSLEKALSFSPEEIFIYPLYIQKETWMHQQGLKQNEAAYEMYWQMMEKLQKEGYYQTSMRRFTKTGEKPATDCGFETTLAIGCGGRSYLENLHFCSPYAIEGAKCRSIIRDYVERDDDKVIDNGYLLSDEEMKRRYVIKNLLHTRGIDLQVYCMRFGTSLQNDFAILHDLERDGYVAEKNGFLRLTSEGLSLSDAIGPLFISDEVRGKMRYNDRS
ncbi:MAG: STM4012 family radical SAM protein [Hungatella sp.]